MERNRENRRNGRVVLEQPLKVVMCSLGAQVKYQLMTRDVSSTGFFLEFDSPGRFPFTMASIMEVWMELDEATTIFFNGKLARIVHQEDVHALENGPGIAIHIVQIDKKNEVELNRFISHKMLEQVKNKEVVA